MSNLGWESRRICYELMNFNTNGEKYHKSILSYGITMPHMLLADHLFAAVVTLLTNYEKPISEEENHYILGYNATMIDPPMACTLLLNYIELHPEENENSLFRIAINCINAFEIKSSEKIINDTRKFIRLSGLDNVVERHE